MEQDFLGTSHDLKFGRIVGCVVRNFEAVQ
jgi:hypothetical protein